MATYGMYQKDIREDAPDARRRREQAEQRPARDGSDSHHMLASFVPRLLPYIFSK